jgi:hypothetical protein
MVHVPYRGSIISAAAQNNVPAVYFQSDFFFNIEDPTLANPVSVVK